MLTAKFVMRLAVGSGKVYQMVKAIFSTLIGIISVLCALPVFASSLEYYTQKRDGFEYHVFVQENGQNFIIEPKIEDWLIHLPLKSIYSVVDLDGDGWPEAIVEASSGGNGIGPTYFVIKRVREGFFTVIEHEDLSGWPSIEIVNQSDKSLIRVNNHSYGVGNTERHETQTDLLLEDGQLKVVASATNHARLFAKIELTSFEARDQGPMTVEYDIDNDGKVDRMKCSYWERWGDLVCSFELTRLGIGKLDTSCNRIGILPSVTDGVHDIVCNNHNLYSWSATESRFLNE